MSAIIPLTKLYFALRPPRGSELHTSVGYSTRYLYTKVAMNFPRISQTHSYAPVSLRPGLRDFAGETRALRALQAL